MSEHTEIILPSRHPSGHLAALADFFTQLLGIHSENLNNISLYPVSHEGRALRSRPRQDGKHPGYDEDHEYLDIVFGDRASAIPGNRLPEHYHPAVAARLFNQIFDNPHACNRVATKDGYSVSFSNLHLPLDSALQTLFIQVKQDKAHGHLLRNAAHFASSLQHLMDAHGRSMRVNFEPESMQAHAKNPEAPIRLRIDGARSKADDALLESLFASMRELELPAYFSNHDLILTVPPAEFRSDVVSKLHAGSFGLEISQIQDHSTAPGPDVAQFMPVLPGLGSDVDTARLRHPQTTNTGQPGKQEPAQEGPQEPGTLSEVERYQASLARRPKLFF